jgi:uncharacterized OB-fold protein
VGTEPEADVGTEPEAAGRAAARRAVREGLFADRADPALLASRCGACGAHHFPRAEACTYCAAEDPEPVELSARGTLWSWTAVTAPPPGYLGEIPFGVGVVELPEGVRVMARLTEPDPGALRAGMAVELCVVPLHRDAEGDEVVTYAFAPVRAEGAPR